MEQVNQTLQSVEINSTRCPSIDDFRNQVYTTIFSLITVIGLAGNGFALVVLIRTYHPNSPFQFYMLNLIVSDLLLVSTLPMRVVYYVNIGQWNLGDFLCRISSWSLYVNLYCSIYFMTAMSVTRFVAIVFPVQNRLMVTMKCTRLVCVTIWIFICLVSSPFLTFGQKFDPLTNKTKCFEPPMGQNVSKVFLLNNLSLVLGFLLPFLIILLCYAGIIYTLLYRTMGVGRQQETGPKAIRLIVIVLLTFLFCFTPYHVQRSVHLHFLSRPHTSCSQTVSMQKSVVVTLCLAAANTCFDPLLYFFSGEAFLKRLSSMRPSRSTGTHNNSVRQNTETENNQQLNATACIPNGQ
ncbi:cysteinyl leukotriene receptor 1-like [Corythoichthys intestinalis]|uniref:cysteinyl leukotriene receptor 1-like n=1 Tax=Corythoichthys intestinalis TaxID=161448 RepID=UPI0025A57B3D|nr:cysteinyl leukotriene receptor 1-like [Corythoichthys intestinalis]XP_057706649.1 cysteinyl leukotriene receptor 1-like [Corythoichthys intestinalis]XP_057706650.1 cysteinyl leukotriene receptor 1-like [Corythoichthys intestinalis]XP_061793247.1 cysteinyl leukotriene receptor 1-like [Nerophis lumbriciformis]